MPNTAVVICVAVYTWEVLADDIKQLTGVDRTFLQKLLSMTKIGRFLRGFLVVDFSAVGFLDLLKT